MNGGKVMERPVNPRTEKKQRDHRQWIEGLLVSAQKRGWFGTITVEIKKGMINLVRSEETLKPPQD